MQTESVLFRYRGKRWFALIVRDEASKELRTYWLHRPTNQLILKMASGETLRRDKATLSPILQIELGGLMADAPFAVDDAYRDLAMEPPSVKTGTDHIEFLDAYFGIDRRNAPCPYPEALMLLIDKVSNLCQKPSLSKQR